jgi:hypothetical protein
MNMITLRTVITNIMLFGVVGAVLCNNSKHDTSIIISFKGDTASFSSPTESEGVRIKSNRADVSIVSTVKDKISIVLRGSTDNGSLTVESAAAVELTLDGVHIGSSLAPAVRIASETKTDIIMNGDNSLSDSPLNDRSATLLSRGTLNFDGDGRLQIFGRAKHAVSARRKIRIGSGDIAIDCPATSDGGKGLTADGDITIDGGRVDILTAADGKVVRLEGDSTDSYTAACIKSNGNIALVGGQIICRSTGKGGKGVVADGSLTIGRAGADNSALRLTVITEGDRFRVSGNGDEREFGPPQGDFPPGDFPPPRDGMFGPGGMAADTAVRIFGPGHENDRRRGFGPPPDMNGERRMGPPPGADSIRERERRMVPPPGFDFGGTDYANPKAVKAEGDLTVNSGTVRISCTGQGGEGIESKAALTINGGDIRVETQDDCLNAGRSIVVNGGEMFCRAAAQDAIDSNGSLTVNGGSIVALGVKGDGEAFDSDREFRINGGDIVGVHGGMSMTEPAGSQYSVRFTATAGSAVSIVGDSGRPIMNFDVPVIAGAKEGDRLTVEYSSPELVGGDYSLMSDGAKRRFRVE